MARTGGAHPRVTGAEEHPAPAGCCGGVSGRRPHSRRTGGMSAIARSGHTAHPRSPVAHRPAARRNPPPGRAGVVAVRDAGGVQPRVRAWRSRSDVAAWVGALTAAGWLVVVTALNLVLPHDVVPDPLYALAPLAACSVLSTRATAVFSVLAVCLTVWSGWWNDLWRTTQQWVRLVDVALVAAAAVVIATVRVRREHRFARMVNIAETAQRAILPTLPAGAGGV